MEADCSLVFTNSPYMTAVINMENAIIDAVTGDLTSAAVYMVTFLIDNK
jgi:hypothetical protein